MMLTYPIKILLICFCISSCSTNIELNSSFCHGEGRWISQEFLLAEQSIKGEQIFEDKDIFVFAGVGVKKITYDELVEDLEIKCSELKTFRMTTYSTWFESILSFIPLFRFRSLRISGSYLKNNDAQLVDKLNKERSLKRNDEVDNLSDKKEDDEVTEIPDVRHETQEVNQSLPSSLIEEEASEDTEYSESDFDD